MPETYDPTAHAAINHEQEKQPESAPADAQTSKKFQGKLRKKTKAEMTGTITDESMAMAIRIAGKVERKLPRHVRGDVLSNALLGLVEAAAKFDRTRGQPFESVLHKRGQGAIRDGQRQGDPLPRSKRTVLNEYKRRPLTDLHEPLPAHVPVEPNMVDVSEIVNLSNDEVPVDEQIDRKRKMEMIQRTVSTLPERTQQILQLYFIEGLTLMEIGEILGVSEPRVCQLYKKGIERIKEILGV